MHSELEQDWQADRNIQLLFKESLFTKTFYILVSTTEKQI